ncbi:hypothetical protein BC008_33135 [Mastigocoleus testarum BC008]|uniref:Uncharacterized protein n=1 Tax=Mastigocoleus testarum BC008 TaxID=371196 RepID=A0A0V7ZVG2_9CYAN|nr:hypothetical protein BC008_31990 [Mastigocoleus testarum BC008]KST68369.1 hypothetical protein BC008_33135 [Mastigocoleus testarum BC008]
MLNVKQHQKKFGCECKILVTLWQFNIRKNIWRILNVQSAEFFFVATVRTDRLVGNYMSGVMFGRSH